jgi:hypothetical protein
LPILEGRSYIKRHLSFFSKIGGTEKVSTPKSESNTTKYGEKGKRNL